jgi:RimJ/RimL family protein N-acetyltransferase
MLVDTDRLRLRLFAAGEILTLIEQPERFDGLTGLPAAPGLREFFTSGEVSPEWLARLRSLSKPDPWSLGFGVVERATETIVGTAGFKSAPDAEGVVEVAYGIVPSREGRGYATEVTNALIAWARANGSVKTIRAHTLPTANASTRVLTKCGFHFVGEVIDPEDGQIWRWERAAETR